MKNEKNDLTQTLERNNDEPMTGESLRKYREKIGMGIEEFLFDLRTKTGEKFSSGHFLQVELGRRPVTERLSKAIKAYKKAT